MTARAKAKDTNDSRNNTLFDRNVPLGQKENLIKGLRKQKEKKKKAAAAKAKAAEVLTSK